MSKTKAQHTPGPWSFREGKYGNVVIESPDSQPAHVATIDGGAPNPRAELLANASLIAAAPDLLDALEWVLPSREECPKCRTLADPCVGHAAIAKARGES